MKALTKILAGGLGVATLSAAAPAAAQYGGYPYGGYGGYGGYGQTNPVQQILNTILGGRSYGQNDRYAIDMCVRATEARLNGYNGVYGGSYGNYGGYGQYGYGNQYAGARVVSVTNVERRSSGLKIHGLATSGQYGQYGYNQGYGGYGGYNQGYGGYGGYGGYNQADLRFNCKVDYRGRVTDVDIDRMRRY